VPQSAQKSTRKPSKSGPSQDRQPSGISLALRQITEGQVGRFPRPSSLIKNGITPDAYMTSAERDHLMILQMVNPRLSAVEERQLRHLEAKVKFVDDLFTPAYALAPAPAPIAKESTDDTSAADHLCNNDVVVSDTSQSNQASSLESSPE
jgi:hypothetical protein